MAPTPTLFNYFSKLGAPTPSNPQPKKAAVLKQVVVNNITVTEGRGYGIPLNKEITLGRDSIRDAKISNKVTIGIGKEHASVPIRALTIQVERGGLKVQPAPQIKNVVYKERADVSQWKPITAASAAVNLRDGALLGFGGTCTQPSFVMLVQLQPSAEASSATPAAAPYKENPGAQASKKVEHIAVSDVSESVASRAPLSNNSPGRRLKVSTPLKAPTPYKPSSLSQPIRLSSSAMSPASSGVLSSSVLSSSLPVETGSFVALSSSSLSSYSSGPISRLTPIRGGTTPSPSTRGRRNSPMIRSATTSSSPAIESVLPPTSIEYKMCQVAQSVFASPSQKKRLSSDESEASPSQPSTKRQAPSPPLPVGGECSDNMIDEAESLAAVVGAETEVETTEGGGVVDMELEAAPACDESVLSGETLERSTNSNVSPSPKRSSASTSPDLATTSAAKDSEDDIASQSTQYPVGQSSCVVQEPGSEAAGSKIEAPTAEAGSVVVNSSSKKSTNSSCEAGGRARNDGGSATKRGKSKLVSHAPRVDKPLPKVMARGWHMEPIPDLPPRPVLDVQYAVGDIVNVLPVWGKGERSRDGGHARIEECCEDNCYRVKQLIGHSKAYVLSSAELEPVTDLDEGLGSSVKKRVRKAPKQWPVWEGKKLSTEEEEKEEGGEEPEESCRSPSPKRRASSKQPAVAKSASKTPVAVPKKKQTAQLKAPSTAPVVRVKTEVKPAKSVSVGKKAASVTTTVASSTTVSSSNITPDVVSTSHVPVPVATKARSTPFGRAAQITKADNEAAIRRERQRELTRGTSTTTSRMTSRVANVVETAISSATDPCSAVVTVCASVYRNQAPPSLLVEKMVEGLTLSSTCPKRAGAISHMLLVTLDGAPGSWQPADWEVLRSLLALASPTGGSAKIKPGTVLALEAIGKALADAPVGKTLLVFADAKDRKDSLRDVVRLSTSLACAAWQNGIGEEQKGIVSRALRAATRVVGLLLARATLEDTNTGIDSVVGGAKEAIMPLINTYPLNALQFLRCLASQRLLNEDLLDSLLRTVRVNSARSTTKEARLLEEFMERAAEKIDFSAKPVRC